MLLCIGDKFTMGRRGQPGPLSDQAKDGGADALRLLSGLDRHARAVQICAQAIWPGISDAADAGGGDDGLEMIPNQPIGHIRSVCRSRTIQHHQVRQYQGHGSVIQYEPTRIV